MRVPSETGGLVGDWSPARFQCRYPVRLGRITKRGEVYLRTLLIHGARAVLRQIARWTDATRRWITARQARRGFHKAVVALAAKQARILWALLATGRPYQPAATCP